MTSKLRLAAVACCALAVTAGAQSPDVTELVQSDLRIHGPGEVALVRHSSGVYRVRSKTLAKGLLRAFVSDGRRWSKLLWGNATAGASGQPEPALGDAAGCSAGEFATAEENVAKLVDDFMKTMQESLPKIMEKTMSSPFGGAPALPFATPFGNGDTQPQGEVDVNIGDLIKLPPACASLLDQENGLAWDGIMSCAQEVSGVSTNCLNCIPQFRNQVKDGCFGQCSSSLGEVAHSLDGALAAVQDKLQKSRSGMFGGMPSQEDKMTVAQGMMDALKSGMKDLAPCGECIAPKAASFAGCVGGEEAAKFVEKRAQELVEGLKSGDLMRVEVDPVMGGGEQEEAIM